jgi:hypothetical protein
MSAKRETLWIIAMLIIALTIFILRITGELT